MFILTFFTASFLVALVRATIAPLARNVSSSSSTLSSSFCAKPTAPYDLPDDPENANWEDDGTDPDTRRKRSGDVIRRADARRKLSFLSSHMH
jgi:hypothetical protein